MRKSLIAIAKKIATVSSLPILAGAAIATAEAPSAYAYEYFGPGQYYNVPYVDLNQLCASQGQGWAYDQVQGNPAYWRCQSGTKVPLATIPVDLRDIVATGSSDPRTAFVVVSNGGNYQDCWGSISGEFDGSQFRVY